MLSKYLDKPHEKIKITGKKQLNFIHPPLKKYYYYVLFQGSNLIIWDYKLNLLLIKGQYNQHFIRIKIRVDF